MGKCHQCSVEILDETELCPLCRSVLERTEEMHAMYPDARVKMRKHVFFSRIYLFCCLVAQVILVSINILDNTQIWWSAVAGLCLLYSYVVLRYAIIGRSGHRSKVALLSLIAILGAIAIDMIIGYRGWSVDYVLPGGILLMDAVILACMYINRRNLQSYMMGQIGTFLCSLIPAALHLAGIEKNVFVSFAPLAASVSIFVGTLLIGGRRAVQEIRRRFHTC